MSTYPILQSNTPIGKLEITADGLYTVFSARCRRVADRLRLSVFSETASAYLGLMLPEGEALTLCRRLTRLEVSRLPSPILFAAEESFRPRETKPAPRANPTEPEGTLRWTEGGREYVAIPAERVRVPELPRELLVTLEGREYLVFPL